MFTGIVDHLGRIVSVVTREKGTRIGIQCQFPVLTEGESIAVNGVCLTVIAPQLNYFECDVSPETLLRTNLNELQVDSFINLERSLSLHDRLGGHFVYGHVDKICFLLDKQQEGDFWNYKLLV